MNSNENEQLIEQKDKEITELEQLVEQKTNEIKRLHAVARNRNRANDEASDKWRFFILEIFGDIEPSLHGSYDTLGKRDTVMLELRRKDPELKNGLYPVNIKGDLSKLQIDTYDLPHEESESPEQQLLRNESLNTYFCKACNLTWSMIWNDTCPDQCPQCFEEIMPEESHKIIGSFKKIQEDRSARVQNQINPVHLYASKSFEVMFEGTEDRDDLIKWYIAGSRDEVIRYLGRRKLSWVSVTESPEEMPPLDDVFDLSPNINPYDDSDIIPRQSVEGLFNPDNDQEDQLDVCLGDDVRMLEERYKTMWSALSNLIEMIDENDIDKLLAHKDAKMILKESLRLKR